LEGDDWFELPGQTGLDWPKVQAVVDEEQRRLATLVSDIGAGRVQTSLDEAKKIELVLGITCHAIYHAGQVQLIKRLHAR
jgi:hypothetical protein